MLSVEKQHKNGEYTYKVLSVRNEWPLFPTCSYGTGIGLPISNNERKNSSFQMSSNID